jgi:glycosyltransferase involved in cell wall biosynthesis
MSPLPWFPKWLTWRIFRQWQNFSTIPTLYEIDGIRVHSPKYFLLPRISESIHAITMFFGIFPAIRRIAREENIEILKVHWLYPDGVCAAWCSKLLKLPIVLSAEGCDVNEFLEHRLKRFQIIRALKHATHVSTVSNPLTEKIASLGISSSKISTVPNGVDSGTFFKDKSDSNGFESAGVKTILYVGRLSDEKDVDILLRATNLMLQDHLDFRLKIVGDGPERTVLKEYVRSHGLDANVEFVGQVPHRQISVYLSQSDVFCLPSKREGCPNVVLESLACGVPVVAFEVGGIPDMVNQDAGILVPIRSAEDLAIALTRALNSNWNRTAIADSVRHLTWENVAAQNIVIFERAIAEFHER